MNKTQKFQTPSGRKLALWGLIVALALLLALPVPSAAEGSNAKGLTLVTESQGRAAALTLAEAQSLISNIQSPVSVTYAYDDAGRLIQADYGGGAVLDYAYDAAGNLLGRGEYNVYVPLVLRQFLRLRSGQAR